MRDAINENPIVQLAVIAILLLCTGLLIAPRMLKGDEKSSPPPPAAGSSASAVPAGSASASAALPSSSTAVPSSSMPSTAPAPTTSIAPDALEPGPGLPAAVVKAWRGGDTVVLLIVRGGGVDDRLVRGSVEGLSSDSRVSVFVARAKRVARYSRITQGVGLNRVPALVVVRPKRLSGQVPQAQVSYGFRDSQSVLQAVHDALYKGRDDIPYYPR
jgi:hypothetical protein